MKTKGIMKPCTNRIGRHLDRNILGLIQKTENMKIQHKHAQARHGQNKTKLIKRLTALIRSRYIGGWVDW